MDTDRGFTTTGQDWANHLSHVVSGNGMIYLIATLSREPSVALLRQAVKDVIDLQPVLGCCFDEATEPPAWIPVHDDAALDILRTDSLRRGLETVTQDASMQKRSLQVTLICTSDQTALCLSFDHAATDGSGAVQCLNLLLRCYRKRYEGSQIEEAFCLDRSDQKVYAGCGMTDYRRALRRESPSTEALATVPFTKAEGRHIQYLWCSLPLSAVRKPGGTVNDRLLAAYALALSRMGKDAQRITLHMTVDLRRYIQPEEAPLAANLSGIEAIHWDRDPGATYPEMLAAASRQTTLLKAQHMGLSSAAMMTYLRALPYAQARAALMDAGRKSRASGQAAPLLSNLGHAFTKEMALGDALVTDVFALLPVLHAPAFMLGAIGYADTLTLSAGIYVEERSLKDTEQFLHSIRTILMDKA